jgi:hypothetical protein
MRPVSRPTQRLRDPLRPFLLRAKLDVDHSCENERCARFDVGVEKVLTKHRNRIAIEPEERVPLVTIRSSQRILKFGVQMERF